MHPAFLDDMSWEMAEVYGAITDQIIINLSRHFPYYNAGADVPHSAFEYQATMLAQMGKVTKETVRIIRNGLEDADEALQTVLEQSIIDAVNTSEPELVEAVKKGLLTPNAVPVVAPNQMRAFKLYYQQAADKLNLVNTVMLESTKSAYQQTVSDVVADIELAERMNATQIAIDAAAGETITGVSSWNSALRHATDKLKNRGITGFIDHAGRQWSAEAYVAMDIRTTVFNTGRAAVWETNQDFGNDLYLVSYHNGARPLCYPWQNKVISSTNNARTVVDLDGNEIPVIAQSETSYGEPAGLFGINCKHYPTPFIPGVSVIDGKPQDPEENAKTYAESQEQRRLERKLREEKRDLMAAKAQGADDEEINRLREKTRQSSQEIDDFCRKTGRARHRDREAVYTQREFPDKEKYDVSKFERKQKDMIDEYFSGGGAQQGYTFGQMTPNVPLVPNPAPVTVPAEPAAVAQEATEQTELEKRLETAGIERIKVEKLKAAVSEEEIIAKIAGADKTGGSCSSVALAYAGQKGGYDVLDFRGGASQLQFSSMGTIKEVSKLPGVVSEMVTGGNDFTNAHTLMKKIAEGKQYYMTAGKHAAIVRKTATGYEYLELQSGYRKHTWYELTDAELKRRFGCQKSHTTYGMKYEVSEVLIEVDSLAKSPEFARVLEFINTLAGNQMKGVGGGEK